MNVHEQFAAAAWMPAGACRNVFAVLEEPPPPAPSSSKSKKWGGRKEDPKAAAAEAAVLSAAIAGATVVRIKSLDGLGVSLVCQQVRAQCSAAAAVAGLAAMACRTLQAGRRVEAEHV
jgi:hypothetical protein